MTKSTHQQPPAGAQPAWAVSVTQLLRRPVTGPDGHPVGGVLDVVAKRSGGPTLWMTGLVIALQDRQVFVPA